MYHLSYLSLQGLKLKTLFLFCIMESILLKMLFVKKPCHCHFIRVSLFQVYWEGIAYPHQDLQFLVALQLLFVEADGFIVMTAEYTITVDHSFSNWTWKLTHTLETFIGQLKKKVSICIKYTAIVLINVWYTVQPQFKCPANCTYLWGVVRERKKERRKIISIWRFLVAFNPLSWKHSVHFN